jgi:hypothetical protein
MLKQNLLPILLALGACNAHTRQAITKPVEGERAQTPNERLGPEAPAPNTVATLDQAIGPQFSKDGERFTATVEPGGALPAGSKLVGQVIDVQPAMAGTMAYAVLAVRGVEGGDAVDARIKAVELLEAQQGGREVNATGAPSSEVIGSIIPADKVPDSDAMNRDPLGRGTVIALGTGSQPHQLDKGTRLIIDLGPDRQNVAGQAELGKPTEVRGKPEAAGRTIKLDAVPVQSVIGDLVFWVGENEAERTLVVLDPAIDEPESKTEIKVGMKVHLEGTVEKTPPKAEAPRLWKMVSKDEAEALPGHPVFIHATRVTPPR